MAEFSTTKITPTDDVQIPSINGQVAGYQENDELKSYVLGTIPTDVSGHTADITGIRGTSLDYDPDSTTYTKGATCILNHIVYRAKQLIPSPAGSFDSSKWEEVSLHEIARKVATNTDAITSLSATTEIDITSYFASDTAITLNTSTVKAYVHGDYVYISIDVTISNTNIHRIAIPNSVLPPPISTCAMSTVDWGNDAVTSQHGVVQWSGTDTRIQLRVSSANIRMLASVTYLKAST